MPHRITSHWPAPARTGDWKVVAFGAALIALFLAATWIGLSRERMATEQQAVMNSANLSRAVEEHVASTVRSIDQMLLEIVSDYRRNPTGFEFDYWVRNKALLLDDRKISITIANADGIVVANSAGVRGYSVGDHDHFTTLRDHAAPEL
jgi:hypothetical protein